MESKKFRVLVVDDDEEVRSTHARVVASCGYEVETARDGIEALAMLELGIDLILLDCEMPHMDGYEVARRVRASPSTRHVPLVMVTAYTRRQDRRRAFAEGVNDFVNKPVDVEELRLRLRWLLELKRTQDQLRTHRAELEDLVEARTQALRRALTEVADAQRQIARAHLETIERLTVAAESKDEDTAQHVVRIGRYSQIVAREMRCTPTFVEAILHGAQLHDVGKIGIPDQILLKPGPLDPREWEIMKTHTTIGAQILAGSSSPVIQMGERIAISHHERWDGGGYPKGLRAEEIPIEGRICAVVDFFDALTMDRPYRGAVEPSQVLQMMKSEEPERFDPDVLRAFLAVQTEIESVRARAV